MHLVHVWRIAALSFDCCVCPAFQNFFRAKRAIYFDQLNLADAITCPTMMASSLTDDVHPLNTVMPVFEKIQAMKSIVVYPDLDHEYRPDFTVTCTAWMDRYLG